MQALHDDSQQLQQQAALTAALDLIDVDPYVVSQDDPTACQRLASCLQHYGAVLIHDARVRPQDGAAFRSLMERYFAQSMRAKLPDIHPEFHYQVGATPAGVERPRRNQQFCNSLTPANRPVSQQAVASRKRDIKWRFFWRIEHHTTTSNTIDSQTHEQLHPPQVVPAAFRHEWSSIMDAFGNGLLQTVETVSEMLAVGLQLPPHTFRDKIAHGPHLLAPTGTDLLVPEIRDKVGATLAGYHYDLNFLTIHAAASFPGLHIWTRDGQRLAVACPPNALLIQTGAQLEHLTGGVIARGFHEVVTTEATVAAARAALADGSSTWRVSSTLFAHVRSSESLAPVGRFADEPDAANYKILARDQVANELRAIALADD